jgi:hypothetical protein
MTKFIFTPRDVEATVAEMDTFRNDIVGTAAFFAGLTALQFPQPAQATSVATSALAFLTFWGYIKALKFKAAHDRYYAGFGPLLGFFVVIARNPVLFVGMFFLITITAGYLDADKLSVFRLALFFKS